MYCVNIGDEYNCTNGRHKLRTLPLDVGNLGHFSISDWLSFTLDIFDFRRNTVYPKTCIICDGKLSILYQIITRKG